MPSYVIDRHESEVIILLHTRGYSADEIAHLLERPKSLIEVYVGQPSIRKARKSYRQACIGRCKRHTTQDVNESIAYLHTQGLSPEAIMRALQIEWRRYIRYRNDAARSHYRAKLYQRWVYPIVAPRRSIQEGKRNAKTQEPTARALRPKHRQGHEPS